MAGTLREPMRNSINLAASVLILVVLGCACPKLEEYTNRHNSSGPASSPIPSNIASDRSPKTAGPVSGLTMEKYNQIKTGMARSQVESLLGAPGNQFSSTSGGGVTFSSYKWEGENFKTIFITFREDKVLSKSQVGLK